MRGVPFIDLHEDISYYYVTGASGLEFPLGDFSKDLRGRHADIPKYKQANVRVVFGSIFCLLGTLNRSTASRLAKGYANPGFARAYTTTAATTTALEHIKFYHALEEMHPSSLFILRRSSDITRVTRGKTGLLVALEGAYSLEDTSDLKLFYEMGLRSLQLAWNFDSRYCASCMSTKDFGLTGEGEDLVRECNRLGIIIDLAHASRKTHLEAAKLSRLPVINSHSNAKAVYDMSRNLDDEMYHAIRGNGGVVGSIFANAMVGVNRDTNSLADHIMYVYERFGPDILAVGTDFFGIIEAGCARGLEDITRLDKLFRALSRKGMSWKDIEKLAFRNPLRVIEANARKWA